MAISSRDGVTKLAFPFILLPFRAVEYKVRQERIVGMMPACSLMHSQSFHAALCNNLR